MKPKTPPSSQASGRPAKATSRRPSAASKSALKPGSRASNTSAKAESAIATAVDCTATSKANAGLSLSSSKSSTAPSSKRLSKPATRIEARGAAEATPLAEQHGRPAQAIRAPRIAVRLDRIIVRPDRLRPIDPAHVAAMRVSIGERGGLDTALLVRPLPTEDDEPLVELVAGGHRLEAVRLEGWERVDCVIKPMTDAEARLAEVDENLIRRDLTPHDRALALQARLEAWAAMFPDRAQAGSEGPAKPKRGRPSNSEKFSEFPTRMGFAEETAAEIGLTDKTVRNALAIARGLSPATHRRVAGSWLAKNEGALRQLAQIADAAEQAKVVSILAKGETKSVSDARAIAAGVTPKSKDPAPAQDPLKALRALWKGASKTDREAILHWLQGQALPGGYAITREPIDG